MGRALYTGKYQKWVKSRVIKRPMRKPLPSKLGGRSRGMENHSETRGDMILAETY